MRKTKNSQMDEVRQLESCFVAPIKKMSRQSLWLTPRDIAMANKGHTPPVHFYRHDAAATDFFSVDRLKKAMAKALVVFYPFAGRLDVDGDGRPKIDCNNEGALFVVAQSQLTVDAFNDLKPSLGLQRLFVPRIEPPSIVTGDLLELWWCGARDGSAPLGR